MCILGFKSEIFVTITSELRSFSMSAAPISLKLRRESRGNSPTRNITSISSPRSRQTSRNISVPDARIWRGNCKISSANSGSKPCNSWKDTSKTGVFDCRERRRRISESFASEKKVFHLAEESCAAIAMSNPRRAFETGVHSL